MKFASEEIRTKAVNAYLNEKIPSKELSKIFGYSVATICNWVRIFQNENRLSANPNGHRPSCFSDEEQKQLGELLESDVDITLSEIKQHFGKDCSLTAIHYHVVKQGYVYKKTLKASEQEREDVKKARAEWIKFQNITPVEHLVFIDETGLKTNMTRLYGRALKNSRCYDSAPDGRWERQTLLSSIRENGATESIVFDGALDRKMFDEYIIKFLAPTLRAGDIVIMDNLNVHKSEKARDAITQMGATVIFLPPYSPDLNPIEKMWSKIKQILRGFKARTIEALSEGVKMALEMVTKNDAFGWFTSCGYIKS